MLAKEINGIESQKSAAAPSPDALAEHFATKMSNGKDVEFDYYFGPQDSKCIPVSSWKIRRKQVKKVLRSIDPSKSANGISPVFWTYIADAISDAVTGLFRRIVMMLFTLLVGKCLESLRRTSEAQ